MANRRYAMGLDYSAAMILNPASSTSLTTRRIPAPIYMTRSTEFLKFTADEIQQSR